MSLPAPYYQDDYATIYHGDCREILPHLPKVDLVLTDPPYGIDYASSRTTRLNGLPRENDSRFGLDKLDTSWIPSAYAVLGRDRLFYIFTRWDVIAPWKAALEHAGFIVVQRLIWDKAHWKMGNLDYYGSQVEDVLLCRKGSRPIFPGGTGRCGNIFRSSSSYLPEGQRNHPTQKPETLCHRFVGDSTQPLDLILDPFMGSGTTLRAAKDLGRKSIGCEIEEKYCEIAAKRMAQEVMGI